MQMIYTHFASKENLHNQTIKILTYAQTKPNETEAFMPSGQKMN